MLFDLLLLFLGCGALYVGADRLIDGAMRLGDTFRMSAALVGVLIVAVSTSLPELAVSLDAALRGHGDIAAGSIVGSNIVNILLVLGAGAVIGHVAASAELRRWDLPFLLILTALSILMLSDFHVGRLEGALLLTATVALVIHRIRVTPAKAAVDTPALSARESSWRSVGAVTLGVCLLVVGAEAMVSSGVGLAGRLGIPEAVIALTVTAIGTGIPEIAATLLAVSRGHHDLALGNIVGSNVMNLGLVLGISSLAAPLTMVGLGWLPLVTMAVATIGLWLLVTWSPGLRKWSGVALLAGFGCYQVALLA
jgi:cation:H+ antiporter